MNLEIGDEFTYKNRFRQQKLCFGQAKNNQKRRQTKNDNKQRQMKSNDKQQTMTNDKQ